MISHILRSSIFIRLVFCFSALSLGSQFPYESPRAAMAPFTQQSAQAPRGLDLGAPIGDRLGAGQSHQYRVALGVGEFMRVVVDQRGVDVEVTVFNPDGKQLFQVDRPIGQYGTESVSVVAESPGDYRIQALATSAIASSGRYQIELKTKRAATPQDRELVKAELTFLDAWSMRRKNDYRGAIIKFEEACDLFRGAGDSDGEARGLTQIGRTYIQLRELEKARDTLLRALSLSKDSLGEGEALKRLGDAYSSLGEREKALDSINRALNLFRQAGNPTWQSIMLNDLGVYYQLIDEPQRALGFFNQALESFREMGDRGNEAEAMHNIAFVYNSLGATQQAARQYEETLKFREMVNNDFGRARTLTSLGAAYNDLGDKEKAEDCHNRALKLFQTLRLQLYEATALNNLGQVYASTSRHQAALDVHNRALELRRKANDRGGVAVSLANIGAAYEALGNNEEALKHYNLALPIYREVFDRRREAITLAQIARVKRVAGHLDESLSRIGDSLKIIEELRAGVVGPEFRASYFATAQRYYEFNIDLLMQMDRERPSAGYKAEALRISERARARSLLDLLAEARADIRAGADPSLLDRERKMELRLRSTPPDKTSEIEKLLAQYHEVSAQIRASSPRYAALTQPVPLTLAEIQRLLDPETLLIEYSLGEKRSYLWIVSQGELISCELPNRDEIESAAERVYNLLTARSRRVQGETPAQRQSRVAEADKQYLEQAMTLSRTLLGPASARRGKKRLLIVAAGKLQLLPFAALPIPNSVGQDASDAPSLAGYQPLVTEHEIVNLPSASTLHALRREAEGRPAATKTVAIFADPVYTRPAAPANRTQTQAMNSWSEEMSRDLIARDLIDARGKFQRLYHSLQESNGIAALAPVNRKLVATRFKASRENVMNLPLGQYRSVHFITHGVLDEEHPELSGLALSLMDKKGRPQDGFLRLSDAYNLNLTSTELVVLSACQTGLGKNVRGEGLVGLTRGFMYAGAPRVVASLWIVNDWGTAELMKRFYQAMLGPKKLSPSAALRDAQEWMWRQKQAPEWRAPYYWAAFTLQGEWR